MMIMKWLVKRQNWVREGRKKKHTHVHTWETGRETDRQQRDRKGNTQREQIAMKIYQLFYHLWRYRKSTRMKVWETSRKSTWSKDILLKSWLYFKCKCNYNYIRSFQVSKPNCLVCIPDHVKWSSYGTSLIMSHKTCHDKNFYYFNAFYFITFTPRKEVGS